MPIDQQPFRGAFIVNSSPQTDFVSVPIEKSLLFLSREIGGPERGCSSQINWDVAIRELREVAGARLYADKLSIEDYAKCTLPRSTKPNCIIQPENAVEVQAIMNIVAKHSLPWHAISCGKNWGYGDACAPDHGRLIVDLKRMNRILEVNEKLAYAVIEPGVTQGQLADHLKRMGSRLMLDVTGAGPDASVVGNTLQRGFGHTPYGDHFANSCNYEVVLPNGELIHTGFGKIQETSVGHVYPYGQGPFTQGNFTQSHAGVVTRMTVWLMPRPEKILGFGFSVLDEGLLGEVIEVVRELRLNNICKSIVHVANDLRVISTQLPDSWTTASSPLSASERASLAKQCGIGAWNGVGGIYGTKREIAAAKHAIRKAFRPITNVTFFSRNLVNLLEYSMPLISKFKIGAKLTRLTHSIRDVFDLLEGIPSPNHLQGAKWRSREAGADLRQNGLIWIAPVLPSTGADARAVIGLISEKFLENGFDPLITVSPITQRSAICIANINFDPSNPEERTRAERCSRELKSLLNLQGYPSYRTASVNLG